MSKLLGMTSHRAVFICGKGVGFCILVSSLILSKTKNIHLCTKTRTPKVRFLVTPHPIPKSYPDKPQRPIKSLLIEALFYPSISGQRKFNVGIRHSSQRVKF